MLVRGGFRCNEYHWFFSSLFTFSSVLLWLGILLNGSAANQCLAAATNSPIQEPQLLSVVPLAVQRGQVVQLTVRGRWLKDATAAWFAQSGLRAELLDV